jgi:hypothetical protein
MPVVALLIVLAQDKPRPMPYTSNYEKALKYVIDRYPKTRWPQPAVVWSGMVFWLDGRPELKEHLEATLKSAIEGCKLDPEEYNGVWFVAYSAMFLTMVYARDPRPEIKEALEAAVRSAEQSQEPTGGWLHHPGGKQLPGGYRRDIAFLTATMLSSMLLVKKAGIQVPDGMIERAHGNLQKIMVNGGLLYGTGGNRRDLGLCRIAAAYPGLKAAGMTSSPVFAAASGLPAAIPKTQDGHGCGPPNFLAMAIAQQAAGTYPAYAAQWLPKLAASQKEDGTVVMLNDGTVDGEAQQPDGGRLMSSATFCLMILMQNRKWFEPPKAATPEKKSPFSQK